MKTILTNRGRLAATVLAATALLLGGTAGATAYAQGPLGGLFGSPATTQTAPTGLGGGVGLPGFGLFKALFAVFGAVRTQVPTIAAPIIAQGVTDGTITSAEAQQLTTWLAGQHAPAMGGAGAGDGTTTQTKPSAGEITVLRKVFAAVLGQLATIAAPVLVAEVQNGDLTQGEADMITKVLSRLAAATSTGTGADAMAPSTAGLGAGAASGNLLATVETKVAAQVKKSTTHHHKRKHKHKTATRTHRAA